MRVKDESNAGVAFKTALITGAATVLTALIGIVPLLRQNAQLKKQTAQAPSGTAYSISGSIRAKNKGIPLSDASLLAAPAADQAALGDDGKFVFPHMRDQFYNVVVRTQDGKTRLVLIGPGQDSATDTDDLAITYSYAKE
jgi:hypothetical protein